MALADYLVPIVSHTNICFDCQKACGDCSWSELDLETKKPRFEPVPGWTAQKTLLYIGAGGKVDKYYVETYHITACPEFMRDEKRKVSYASVTDEQFDLILKRWKRMGEF